MSNPANRLPPDFDDMHPSDYDPQFTADINTKMRVPERIGLIDGDDDLDDRLNPGTYADHNAQNMRRSMNVPERILIAGQDETVGLKNDPHFELHDPTIVGEPFSHVSLSTPPRNLKLDEDIYSFNDHDLEGKLAAVAQNQYSQNGYVGGATHLVSRDGDREPVTPPPPTEVNRRSDMSLLASPSGDLMIHDMDDMSAVRVKLDKLTRHVRRLEQENEKRSQREQFLYPALIGYLLFQVAKWLLRN